jgi:hypothetical protein
MLPFIIAFVLAVGLPLLPDSLHRALHLPTLKFNFLSASHTSGQVSVPTLETSLPYEDGRYEDHADSNGPLQYLVLPPISIPNYLDDAAATPASMSLTETAEYYPSSIWDAIHARVLYRLVEATVIMTISFFVASMILPHHCLSTLTERLYTALFICWQYGPKAALSSFLQDVFCGIHKFWMDNSVTMGQSSRTTTSTTRQAAIGVFSNVLSDECCESDASSPSSATLQDDLDLVALGKVNVCSKGSPSPLLATPPLSVSSLPASPTYARSLAIYPHLPRNTTVMSEQQRSPDTLGLPLPRSPAPVAKPSVILKATCDGLDATDIDTSSDSRITLSDAIEETGTNRDASFPITPSLTHDSTLSFLSISMKDLYTLCATPISPLIPPYGGDETAASHTMVRNVTCITPNSRPEKCPTEGHHTSSLGISHSYRRRYRSDSIQVRSTRCHLGDPAAPLDPAKVDVTCAFWESALERREKKVEALGREVLALEFLSGSLDEMRIRRNQPEGNLSAVGAAIAGIVDTPEGELIVPESQRQDERYRIHFSFFIYVLFKAQTVCVKKLKSALISSCKGRSQKSLAPQQRVQGR